MNLWINGPIISESLMISTVVAMRMQQTESITYGKTSLYNLALIISAGTLSSIEITGTLSSIEIN